MKKIFTLLFCVCAVAIAAHADTARIEQCINIVLGVEQPTTLMAANYDANNDGAIDINDVTALIAMELANKPAKGQAKQPKQPIDVDAIIKDIVDDVPPTPNLGDVNEAIGKNLEE